MELNSKEILEKCRIDPTVDVLDKGIYDPSKVKTDTFGGWSVYLNGDLCHHYYAYDISHDRLDEPDWIVHLLEKDWVNLNDLIPAYFQALRNAGRKSVTINIEY